MKAPDFLQVSGDILLSAFRPEDKPDLLYWLQDETVHRLTATLPYPYTQKDADEWIELTQQLEERYPCRPNWAIRIPTGRLIGGIGRVMNKGEANHWDEIGYWLAAPYRGRGIMTEVVRAFCQHWFETSPLVRIEANVYEINPASARVLEKAGFRLEGRLLKKYLKNGVFLDSLLYARLKNEL